VGGGKDSEELIFIWK